MTFPRRSPARIASELLDCIDEKKGRASKWDLIKIVGNESQYNHWVQDFLIKDGFIDCQVDADHNFHRKTDTGELLHRLLKNGKIMHAFLRVSGKKLRY